MGKNSMERLVKISHHLQRSETLASNNQSSSGIPVNKTVVDGIDMPLSVERPAASKITDELLRQYEEDGYFIVKGLLNEAEVREYTNRFKEIGEKKVEIPGMTLMRDVALAKKMKKEGRKDLKGLSEVTKIQDWHNDEGGLMNYVRNKKIVEYVSGLLGPNIRGMHTMVINKPPDLGEGTSEHPMHQDLLYFPFRPSNSIVASWTALQPIDEENGCLMVIPGTHKLGLYSHNHPEQNGNMGYYGVKQDWVKQLAEERGVVKAIMEPGDTIFFHPCIIHGSGPNLSGRFRLAISCHYASGLTTFSQIPDHNYVLLDEVIASLIKKQIGHNPTNIMKVLSREEKLALYQIGWKNKSRRVLGNQDFDWKVGKKEMNNVNKIIEKMLKVAAEE